MFTPNINAQQGNQQAQSAGAKQTNNGNRIEVPQAKDALNNMKYEIARELVVNLKQGYNGDLTSREAGSDGGQMVKKMIESYERNMK